ncbi:Mitochondrial outer membrane protein IML2 [Leucoagaricus sp. SymC.cos]|nr:Mitochondrial outer membrane protein IML2 [Leucoagaricus sp. SymC.cos]
MIPGFVDKKLGGKELPTEVFLKKKIAFYKAKQKRLGKNEAKFVEAITISPSNEMGLFWNTHARISESVALLHIREWYSTAPVPPIVSPHHSPSASPPPTLDTPVEFALQALLLGVVHRTIKSYDTSRGFLNGACERQESIVTSTWIGGIANFELAVLELKGAEAFENAYYSTNGSATTGSSTPTTPASTESSTNTQSAMAVMDRWKQAFTVATANLDKAMSLVNAGYEG